MPRKLSELLSRARPLALEPGQAFGADPEIAGLAYDSRAVRPGYLFFALPGARSDGRAFIPEAIRRGASAIVYEDGAGIALPPEASLAARCRVADARASMSPIASAFHGDPSSSLRVIGVTGTEGKSSTVSFISQLLELSGVRTGFISTVQHKIGDRAEDNPEHQTTPEAPVVQEALAGMRDSGRAAAVIEASSHGLSPRLGRLADVRFDIGVFLNVTHEHLEFHGSFERYRDDKANLFRALDRSAEGLAGGSKAAGRTGGSEPFGVVNRDDPSAEYFRAATKRRVVSYALGEGAADLRAIEIRGDPAGSDFTLASAKGSIRARVNLPGAFNVPNALAALLAAAGYLGKDPLELAGFLPSLSPVRGRMTVIDMGQPFAVVVDYAHTPSSFQAVFPSLRDSCRGRLISLFGSGGERDVEKRPMQGRVAADYSDIVILADEDPRGEDPRELLEMIAAGCPERERDGDLFIVPDRPLAIRKALALAGPGDTVALLGKGHENSIIGRSGAVPYDEIEEAKEALSEMGFKKGEAHAAGRLG
jgi:UDP-N-acetylmuramoyl-L-alanyl-D-glutamate--2,6-diaminopimelate ligase